jgi:hypothetical protein
VHERHRDEREDPGSGSDGPSEDAVPAPPERADADGHIDVLA